MIETVLDSFLRNGFYLRLLSRVTDRKTYVVRFATPGEASSEKLYENIRDAAIYFDTLADEFDMRTHISDIY